MKKISILFGLYFLVIFTLFLYSYTQVDLSLTFSRASIFQTIEKGFQYIGYFNRPLSTFLYSIIVGLLFIFYGIFLRTAYKKEITLKRLWPLLLAVGVILTFTYNAFSYDLFNYIFAAKVLVHYHQNPYLVKALDFPKDPMLSFMHWTHNTYVYGPVALGITIPFYVIGFGYFLPTFFLFKILSTACFFGTIYFLQKIFQKINPGQATFGIILYALNPLVLIECLVSAHNDVIMMFFAIVGIYLLLQKKWMWGLMAIIISALTKQVTVFLLFPALAYAISSILKKKAVSETGFVWLCAIAMLAGYLYVLTQIGLQPWYALWFLPFFFLLKLPRYILALLIGFSLGVLLRYVPFLWQGDWNGMANAVMVSVTLITPIVFLIGTFAGTTLRHNLVKR